MHCAWLTRHINMKNLRDGIYGPESLSAIQQAFNQAWYIFRSQPRQSDYGTDEVEARDVPTVNC